MGLEFELKYRISPELLTRLRRELPGEEVLLQMQTTYYDTPTAAFSLRHCTLRCRKENERYVCTLKAPAAGFGRREWEVECEDIQTAVSMLCKPGAPEEILSLAQEGLIPICGARFTRIAKTVQLNGCLVELALDEGVLTGGGKQLPLCELEVELKQGDSTLCVAYGKSLEQLYGLIPEENSKFRRALALYKGEA